MMGQLEAINWILMKVNQYKEESKFVIVEGNKVWMKEKRSPLKIMVYTILSCRNSLFL